MQTYTVVDGEAYRGSLRRDRRVVWSRDGGAMEVVASYLSADLGDAGWVSIEALSEDENTAPTADKLREELAAVIRGKLAHARLVH